MRIQYQIITGLGTLVAAVMIAGGAAIWATKDDQYIDYSLGEDVPIEVPSGNTDEVNYCQVKGRINNLDELIKKSNYLSRERTPSQFKRAVEDYDGNKDSGLENGKVWIPYVGQCPTYKNVSKSAR